MWDWCKGHASSASKRGPTGIEVKQGVAAGMRVHERRVHRNCVLFDDEGANMEQRRRRGPRNRWPFKIVTFITHSITHSLNSLIAVSCPNPPKSQRLHGPLGLSGTDDP